MAAQALKAANVRINAMLARVDKRKPRERETVRAVGRALARVVLCRVGLLLATECRGSPRHAALTHAQQCLAQWEKLLRWRFTTQLEPSDLVRWLPQTVCYQVFRASHAGIAVACKALP